MSNKYIESSLLEYEKLLTQSSFNTDFIYNNNNEIKKIFNYIYIINLLKNRAETKRFFGTDFNMTFSLLLESSNSLYSGQCRASLLLLRSAQESTLQFITIKEREWILSNIDSSRQFIELDYRFTETKKKLVKDIKTSVDSNKYSEYYKNIDKTVTYYKKLCGVVHSTGKNIPVELSYYYSNLEVNTILEKKDFFELYLKSLECIFTLIYFLLRESFEKWDTYDLSDILKTIFKKDKKVQRFISFVK